MNDFLICLDHTFYDIKIVKQKYYERTFTLLCWYKNNPSKNIEIYNGLHYIKLKKLIKD